MKNKTIKIFGILCAALIAITCAVLFMGSSCTGEQPIYEEVFERNWKVTLPENMDKQFHKSEDNWGFDWIGYAIFGLEEEPSKFLEDFNKEKNKEIEDIVDHLLLIANISVPVHHQPDWNEKYCWKLLEQETYNHEMGYVTSSCYMMFFYDSYRLAICQEIVQ